MKIGYGRVPPAPRTPNAQHDALTAAGCDPVFIDKASGKLASRPELDKALMVARGGDQLVVTKLDRLGRSLEHLISLASLYERRGRPDEAIWMSPHTGRERYDLCDETRNKGLRELVDRGLLGLRRRPVPASVGERFRVRNAYVVRHGAWARPAQAD